MLDYLQLRSWGVLYAPHFWMWGCLKHLDTASSLELPNCGWTAVSVCGLWAWHTCKLTPSLWVSSTQGCDPQTFPLANETGTGPLCYIICDSSVQVRLPLGFFKWEFRQYWSGHKLRACIRVLTAWLIIRLLNFCCFHIRIFHGY